MDGKYHRELVAKHEAVSRIIAPGLDQEAIRRMVDVAWERLRLASPGAEAFEITAIVAEAMMLSYVPSGNPGITELGVRDAAAMIERATGEDFARSLRIAIGLAQDESYADAHEIALAGIQRVWKDDKEASAKSEQRHARREARRDQPWRKGHA